MHTLLNSQLAQARHADAMRAASRHHEAQQDTAPGSPRVTLASRRARSGSRRRLLSVLRLSH